MQKSIASLPTSVHFHLMTTFQSTVQLSLSLSSSPAPQQTPFIHKYSAIQKLKSLLLVKHPYHFIVYTILGEIYNDVEQISDSIRCYESALGGLAKLGQTEIQKFLYYLIVVYNMLGMSYVNRQRVDQGIGCIMKAIDVYSQVQKRDKQTAETEDFCHNRADQRAKGRWRCYYQGGINREQLENAHTLSLFYLAQSYTKLGLKDKAAQYCGFTLQRQYATNKFQLNDFCHNLIGLAEYYDGNKYFAQSIYLLLLALQVLPQGKKKKMRAKIQIALGTTFSKILQYSIQLIKSSESSPDLFAISSQKSNKRLLLFSSFTQKTFPTVELAHDLEECKSYFRKALTQYKEAISIFVLDGYVTEHIDILFAMSRLYFLLSKIDKSRERVCAMLDKRRQMLQPLLKQLNNKAFPATWQKILIETSQIYNDLFQLKTLITLDIKPTQKISQQKLRFSTQLGTKLIKFYQMILTELVQDKDTQKNATYYRSIINSKFNIAKTWSKMYGTEKEERVQFLRKAWYAYRELGDYIGKLGKGGEPVGKEEFEKELEMTMEMVAMLPNKIDRINCGQISPFQ